MTGAADIEELAQHLRGADLLDPAELRELIPSLLILERVAVQESPAFDAEAIAELRAANRRLLDSAGDAAAAAQADDDFHRRLTAGCRNASLLEVVDLMRKALIGYERRYMLSPERLARSVDEHEAIVTALESGDHALASERVRVNFTSGPSGPGGAAPRPGWLVTSQNPGSFRSAFLRSRRIRRRRPWPSVRRS